MSLDLKIDIKEEGLPQFLVSLRGVPKKLDIASFEGLKAGAQQMVDQTKANILALFHSRTSNLYNSIKVLESTEGGNIMSVTIGSTLPGYPFYHEFGYTARLPSGQTRDISPKFYMMNAIIQVAPRVPDTVRTLFESQGDVM